MERAHDTEEKNENDKNKNKENNACVKTHVIVVCENESGELIWCVVVVVVFYLAQYSKRGSKDFVIPLCGD